MVYDERNVVNKVAQKWENTQRSSRVSQDPINERSSVIVNQTATNTFKRSSDSLPKPIINVNHPNRCTSTVIDQIPYFIKHSSPQVKAQPQPHHQSFTFTPYMNNNSLPVALGKPNHNSRIEVRVNSSEKNIKENHKNPMTQSYM